MAVFSDAGFIEGKTSKLNPSTGLTIDRLN